MSDAAPDLIEPLVGFRVFEVDEDEWLGGGHGMWKPGLNVATCKGGYERRRKEAHHRAMFNIGMPSKYHTEEVVVPPRGHRAPHEHCDCGFYAMHSLEALREFCGGYIDAGGKVVAAVASEGKVCLHGTGFRAEKAKIVAVAASDEKWEPRIDVIARGYQAKAVPLDQLEALAAEYGAIAPPSLTPGSQPKEEPAASEKTEEKPPAPSFVPVPSLPFGQVDVKEPWLLRHHHAVLNGAIALNLAAFALNMTGALS